MPKLFPFLLLLSVCIYSCQSGQPSPAAMAKTIRNAKPLLSDSDMYDRDKTWHYDSVAPAENRAYAQQLFMQAQELQRQGRLREAADTMRKSILYFPDNNICLAYGALLAENKDYARSIRILSMFDQTKLAPEAEFQLARVYARQPKTDTRSMFGHLHNALMFEMNDKDRVLKDPLFNFVHNRDEYQSMIGQFWPNSAQHKTYFAEFVSRFPVATVPFVIGEGTLQWKKEREISDHCMAFVCGGEDSRFSRTQTDYYNAVAKINDTREWPFSLYMYSVDNVTVDSPYVDAIGYMTTCNDLGIPLDHLRFGERSDGSGITKGEILPGYKIKTMTWNVPRDADDRYHEQDYVYDSTCYYHIDMSGHFHRDKTVKEQGIKALPNLGRIVEQ